MILITGSTPRLQIDLSSQKGHYFSNSEEGMTFERLLNVVIIGYVKYSLTISLFSLNNCLT